MSSWTRRNILGSAAALSTLPALLIDKKAAAEKPNSAATSKTPKPLIHVTDLFRPHNDPDDHWDLATAYALTWHGDLDLVGVLIDNPVNIAELPEQQKILDDWADNHVHVARSPDVAAVAQLNYLNDRAVAVATGTIWPNKPGERVRADNLPKELRGVNMLLDILRRSPQPVAILIGGSSQDVAIAGMREPRLFSEKCAGIYLNAGIGDPDPKKQMVGERIEWNVSLNRGAYATIFELPCPIYWMPCFNVFSTGNASVGEYGTYWSFRQREVLPHLSSRVQAFIAYVLSKESGTNWLSYLLDASSKDAAQRYLNEERGMYCTAGFVHAAGKTVTVDGKVVSPEVAKEEAAYEFVPIEVRCDSKGITEWRNAQKPTNRYIFRVRDKERYAKAMIAALKSVLLESP